MFTEEQAAAYLAGIIDGEGHVHNYNKAISIGNTDYEIVEAFEQCCAILGLYCKTYPREPKGNRKLYWEVHIRGRESLERVAEIVPIQVERKRTRLKEQIASYKYAARPSREWLYEKYVVEGLTGPEVAELAGTSYGPVYKWLRQYGIPVKEGSARPRIEPPPREWLVDQYVGGKRSMKDIAEELGVAHTTVYRWLQGYQIPSNHQKVE